jgi:hypothetical protein
MDNNVTSECLSVVGSSNQNRTTTFCNGTRRLVQLIMCEAHQVRFVPCGIVKTAILEAHAGVTPISPSRHSGTVASVGSHTQLVIVRYTNTATKHISTQVYKSASLQAAYGPSFAK